LQAPSGEEDESFSHDSRLGPFSFGGEVMENLTQERLKELLDYNPDTGIFIWKVSGHGCETGDVAGSLNNRGYRQIGIDYKVYRASRLAWLYMESYFPEHDVDHINRVEGDDKWSNLRHVSHQCNLRNCGRHRNNKSGVTGVSWHKQNEKWVAMIMAVDKQKHLGYFKEKKML